MRLIIDSSPSLKARTQRAFIFLLLAFKQLKGGNVTFSFDRFGNADEFRNRTGFLYLFIDADQQAIDCLVKRPAVDHHSK